MPKTDCIRTLRTAERVAASLSSKRPDLTYKIYGVHGGWAVSHLYAGKAHLEYKAGRAV